MRLARASDRGPVCAREASQIRAFRGTIWFFGPWWVLVVWLRDAKAFLRRLRFVFVFASNFKNLISRSLIIYLWPRLRSARALLRNHHIHHYVSLCRLQRQSELTFFWEVKLNSQFKKLIFKSLAAASGETCRNPITCIGLYVAKIFNFLRHFVQNIKILVKWQKTRN